MNIIEFRPQTEEIVYVPETGTYIIKPIGIYKKRRNKMFKIISGYEYKEIVKKISDYKELKKQYESMRENYKKLGRDQEDSEKKRLLELDAVRVDYEIKEKKAVVAMEDKISKQRNDLEKSHDREISKLREKLTEEKNKDLEKMMKDHYKKLSDSMAKLHEEGNASTKHMQEITKEIIRATGLSNANSVKRIENNG